MRWAALVAIGYDPDAIREQYELDRGPHPVEQGQRSRQSVGGTCPVCGAPADAPCTGPCKGEQVS